MMACFIKKCKNLRRFLPQDSGISFHRFPCNETMYHKWLTAIGREHENVTRKKTMYICSEHFQKSDFKNDTDYRILDPSAIPSLKINPSEEMDIKISPTEIQPYLQPSSSNTKLQESPEIPHIHNITIYKVSSTFSSDCDARSKLKLILLDHNYVTTPETLKRKSEAVKRRYTTQSSELYRAQETVENLKRKLKEKLLL